MKWLYRIVDRMMGCRHRWKVRNTIRVMENANSQLPLAYEYVLECVKCGDLIKKKI